MKPKFEKIAKVFDAKWVGYVAAGVAAIAAFGSSMQEQQKEKAFKELSDRVSQLESK